MNNYTILCKNCNAHIIVNDNHFESIECGVCQTIQDVDPPLENVEEICCYAVDAPYIFISIVKNTESLQKTYRVLEPYLSQNEKEVFVFIRNELISRFSIRLDELEENPESFLIEQFQQVIQEYGISLDDILEKKYLYYLNRFFLGYDKIDPFMKDPDIEDISCDGAKVPIFIHHREFGSLESNILFETDDQLTQFVVKLAQKCGKHISVSNPMLDATIPDGSRIQMTLSSEVTTKGSTFTIRRFKSDPITPVDLIEYNTMSPEILAYLWLAVEQGTNALISGGTASGKTSILNAICLFIPREAKIVSIEETREINLPHPNWIPGITRSGFGEILNDRLIGEIDLFDLMKAALRQRPEYILVGEIRGKEAYVLFQAMATGHTTYSTVHADSMKALIHRLEGKPINIPRNMLQSLDIVILQSLVKIKGKTVRRCKEIIELITVDVETQEFLTNSVFKWDPSTDEFRYTGKSFILEKIRELHEYSADEMRKEVKQRQSILDWMHRHMIRDFEQVGQIVSSYAENPAHVIERISSIPKKSLLMKASELKSTQIDENKIKSLYDIGSINEKPLVSSNNEKKNFFIRLKRKNK
jgi:flagellar protein FlaI